MKNSLRNIIFILLLAVGAVVCQPALADTCKTDQLENIKSQLNQAAKDACNEFKSQAADYNSKASSYISSCNPLMAASSSSIPSQEDLTAAGAAGADITDVELYKYKDLPWSTVADPGENETCVTKVAEAQQAYQEYQKAYGKMMRRIQATKNPAVTACSCDANGQNPDCLSINKTTSEVADQEGDCPPVQSFQQLLSGCPLCSIFEVVLSTSSKIAEVAWNAVAKDLIKVIGVFFLVLLALEALKSVAAIGGLKISSYLKTVLTLGL